MRHFMLLVGMGTSLIASAACRATPQRPVAAAAVADEAETVRRLLADGNPPDDAGEDGMTPLMWAARYGAVDAMTTLLDAGADANARDRRNRWTPLLHAIHRQRPRAVRLLLERGADANAASPDGITPLLMAADDSDPTTVKALLEYGGNPRAEGPRGATPLSQAVSGGAFTDIDRPLLGGCRTATVRALVAHDPSLRLAKNAAGHEAIWWARFHGCAEVLEIVGASPTQNLQTLLAIGGILRARLHERQPDAPAPRPATDARCQP